MKLLSMLFIICICVLPGCSEENDILSFAQTTGRVTGKVYAAKSIMAVPSLSGDYLPSDYSSAAASVKYMNGTETALCDENGNYAIDNLPAGTYYLTVQYNNYGTIIKPVIVTAGQTTDANIYVDTDGYFSTAAIAVQRALQDGISMAEFFTDTAVLNDISGGNTIQGAEAVSTYLAGYIKGLVNTDVRVSLSSVNTEISEIKISVSYYAAIEDQTLGLPGQPYGKSGEIALRYTMNDKNFRITKVDINMADADFDTAAVKRLVNKYISDYEIEDVTGIASIMLASDENYEPFLQNLSGIFDFKEKISYCADIEGISFDTDIAYVTTVSTISYIDVIDGKTKTEQAKETFSAVKTDSVWKLYPAIQIEAL